MAENIAKPEGTYLNLAVMSLLCGVADFIAKHPELRSEMGDCIIEYADRFSEERPVDIKLPKPFGKVIEALLENDEQLAQIQELEDEIKRLEGKS